MIRALPLAVSLALLPVPALAHKVILGVFPSGAQIEGELGLSNGEMAAAGTRVEVFDGAGARLGEAMTDADGFFLFTPTEAVSHVFRANLGAGHVAETAMPAEDVAAVLGKAAPAGLPAGAAAASPGGAATIAHSAAPAAAAGPGADEIARIVRDEMRPLRQEIAAYREKNDLQNILGGIGYIAGLFGLGFYLAARHRLGKSA